MTELVITYLVVTINLGVMAYFLLRNNIADIKAYIEVRNRKKRDLHYRKCL